MYPTRASIPMARLGLFASLLLLVATGACVADSVTVVSVNQAIAHALQSNPDLEIYRRHRLKAEYDYNTVKYHWLPRVSATLSGVNNFHLPVTTLPGQLLGQPGTTVEATFGQQYNYNAGLSVSSSILDLQSHYSAKAAQVSIPLSAANEGMYRQTLAEQVALQYYTALITARALDVQEEDYRAASSILMVAEQKFDQGIVDQQALNLARINRNTIRQNIHSSRLVLEQSHATLRTLLGLDAATDLLFDEKLESHDGWIPSVDRIAPDKRLEIYRLQMLQSDYRISQQRAEWYPKVNYNVYWGGQQYNDRLRISLNSDDWSTVSYLALGISIPIFNGGATKSRVDAAHVQGDIARLTLEQEEYKSTIADELLLRQFNVTREALAVALDSYQVAKATADLQFQKSDKGLASLNEYLDSFDDYLRAEITYLNLLADAYRYYATILSRNQ